MSPKRKRRKSQPRPGVSLRDKYLRAKFNISEEEYNAALFAQAGHCKGCPYVPTTVSLHVDHDHAIAGWKVSSRKEGKEWFAWPSGEVPKMLEWSVSDRTKPLA